MAKKRCSSSTHPGTSSNISCANAENSVRPFFAQLLMLRHTHEVVVSEQYTVPTLGCGCIYLGSPPTACCYRSTSSFTSAFLTAIVLDGW